MAYHKVNILAFVFYMIAMTAFMIFTGVGITPDRYVLILVLAALFLHKTRRFLLDWLPFIFILISYDFLRSLAPILNPRVHYLEMINFDLALFGQNPIVFLQNFFYHGQISFLDYFSTLFYFLHFALPLGFGFILWIKNRYFFKKFSISLLILSYSAFFTFVVFPAAPPWLAEKHGDLDGVVKILDITLKSFPTRLQLPTIYQSFNPNTVAAVPSLHGAYPFLVFLYSLKFFKFKGLYFIPYVLGVWFSIVYLGEHYVFDIFAGVVYAIAAFYSSETIFSLWRRIKSKKLLAIDIIR